MKPYYVTADALIKLKEEINQLKTVKRPTVIDRIQKARELGDLSENADYSDAKEEQGFIEGRILELEDMVRNAVIINGQNGGGTVKIGSTVVAECDNVGKKGYTIVGSKEAQPGLGLISNESPFGQAFLGRKVGDEISVTVPKGVMKCKIVEIK